MDEVYKASCWRPHADRERTRTTPTRQPVCCSTPSPRRCWAATCRSPAWARPMSITSRSSSAGRRQRTARREAAAVRPAAAGCGAQGRARHAVRLPRAADLYDRYFLHVGKTRIEMPQAFFMRVAMGCRSTRSTARPRDRVLRGPVLVRLHVQHAHALFNSGTLPLAAVLLLPDPCPTTWTASTSPSRKTRCCPSSPAAWATTGPMCVRWARTSRAPMASPGRGSVPEGRQRHRGGRQPGRQAQGRGLHLSGTWHLDIESSWSCARTPATTAAVRTT